MSGGRAGSSRVTQGTHWAGDWKRVEDGTFMWSSWNCEESYVREEAAYNTRNSGGHH